MTLVPCLLLVVAPQAAGDRTRVELPSPPAARCIRILRDSRRPDAAPAADLVRALACDAGPALPELVELMVAGVLPALEEEERAQTLSTPQRDLLLRALADLPPAQVVLEADRLTAEGPVGPDPRAVALRLVALAGSGRDLPRLARLACAVDVPLHGRTEQAFEWAVELLLRRDGPGTRRALIRLHGEEDQPLLPAVLRALAEAGDPMGLEVLQPIAQRRPELRAQAFAYARRLGRSGDPVLDERVARLLRDELDPHEPRLARVAALALGEFGDAQAVPALVAFLSEPGLEGEAHWALCRITGLRLAPDPERWTIWLREELRFFQREYVGCLADLHGADPARAVSAVRELSRHRLRREELASELSLALVQGPAAPRAMICTALEGLGCDLALAALVETLGDDDPRVLRAAHRALLALTGLDLPAQPEAWRAALEPRPG